MVKIRVDGDTKDFEQKLDGLGKTGEKALSGLKAAIAALGIAKLAQEVFQVGLAFESAFAGVIKTVDATDAELAQMREEIIGLSQVIPVTASELASIAESAGQLGIANGNITSFTKTMANLAVATNLTSEEAATLLARFANVTGLAQTEFENLGSAVVALGNTMATTESEIVAMAQRMAGAATNAGFAESEIMALAAALSSVGMEAQAGGSSMVRTMNTIDAAVRDSGDELERLGEVTGMTGKEFAALWNRDAAGAFDSLIKGLGEVSKSGGSVAGTLEELGITATMDITALTSLAGASDLFSTAMETANTAFAENTALANEAEQRYKTLESQIQMFTNSAQALAIGIYDTMRPAFVEAVEGMRAAVDSLQASFAKPDVQNALAAIGKSLSTFATIVSKLVATVLPPLVRIIGTVASAANQMYNQFKPIATFFIGTLTKALDMVASGFEFISSNMQVFGPIIVTVVAATIAYNAAVSVQTLLEKARNGELAKNGVLMLAKKAYDTASIAIMAAQTGQTFAATVAQEGLNAAMLANPVGLLVAAIVGLIAALAVLVGWLGRNSDELQAMYDRANDVTEANTSLLDSVQQSADAFKENESAISNNAGAAETLANRLYDLADKTERTAAEEQQMLILVNQLNEAVPGLNLQYNAQTQALNKNRDATLKNVAAQRSALEAQAKAARAADLAKEQEELQEQLEATANSILELQEVSDIDKWKSREWSDTVEGLVSEYEELERTIADNEVKIGEYLDASADATIAAEEQAIAVAYSEEALRAMAEQYGTTVEAIRGATDGTVESLNAWQAKQDELAAATDERAAEMASRYYELADKATNALDRIAQAEALNAWQLLENVTQNTDTMNRFAENTEAARTRVGENSPLAELVNQLAAKGPEYADQLAVIANLTDAQLESLSTAFGENAEAALAAMGVEFGAGADVGAGAIDEIAAGIDANAAMEKSAGKAVEGAIKAINSAIASANMPGIGSDLVAGIAQGVASGSGMLSAAMSKVVEDAIAAAKATGEIRSPSRRMRREVGRQLPAGMAEGIADGTKDAVSAAERQAEAVLGAYGGLDTNIGVAALATQMTGIFEDVPDEFFTMGETAGAQFVAGFDAAAFGFFALFEQMMAGDVLMAANVGNGTRGDTNMELHFHKQVEAPDTVAREIQKTQTYGLAGERI